MKRNIATLTLAMAAAVPAFATSGFTPVAGEAGSTTHPMPGAKSRAEVQAEAAAWKRNPVTADGWRDTGGEAGWVYVGASGQDASKRAQRVAFDGQGLPLSRSGHQSEAAARPHGHR